MTAFCQRAVFALMTLALSVLLSHGTAYAAITIPLTVNLSENVTVTGTPRIAVDVGGTTRYADYTGGSGSSTLTFTLSPQAGDVDLDGITVTSPIQLNSGTIKDAAGNDATLTFTPPNTSGIKIDYPSLSLDFIADADGRYTLNGTVYNDLTSFLSAAGGAFSRASTATYFDISGVMQTASSGTPRFDYDPVTHATKGLLIEESRTNYNKSSSILPTHLNNTPTITSNVGTDPMGGTTADQIDAGANNYGVWGDNTVTPLSASTQYTISAFVKRISGGNRIVFGVPNQFTGNAGDWVTTFDFSTNSFSGTNANLSNTTYKDIGNGWIRISFTATTAATSTGGGPVLYAAGSAIIFQVWGIQTEAGVTTTSYIPTSGATVTRNSDSISMPTGSWYNSSTGTALASVSLPNLGGVKYPGLYAFDDGTANNSIYADIADVTSDQLSSLIVAGGTFSFSGTGTTVLAGNTYKFASYYNGAIGARCASNGTLHGLDSSITLPTVTTLRLGRQRGASDPLNGWISAFKYYPLQVADTQLQLLSQ